jgi:hypothetical protein
MRKCANCRVFFVPDKRNAWRQKYCTQPHCRKASKAASHKTWLAKEENLDHFRGPVNVRRVQEWRKNHPGYWRRKIPKGKDALQDILIENQSIDSIVTDHSTEPLQDIITDKSLQNQEVEPNSGAAGNFALQDILNLQHAVLIGLIAHLTGSALQDIIVPTFRRMGELGRDILNQPYFKGGHHDAQTSSLP